MWKWIGRDLQHPGWMWTKAALFLVLGGMSAGLVWSSAPTIKNALLLAITIWAFCRACYFAFYVLEHYIDPTFRYAGLWALVKAIVRQRK